jgi:hypothetical protein
MNNQLNPPAIKPALKASEKKRARMKRTLQTS